MDAETVLSMGKYALHVWGAYGLSALVYGGLLVSVVCRLHRLSKEAAR